MYNHVDLNFMVKNEFCLTSDAICFSREDHSKCNTKNVYRDGVLVGFKCQEQKCDLIPATFVWLNKNQNILDALVIAGIFKSKGDARKNWKGPVEIPNYYSGFENIGKAKSSIYFWNPTELFKQSDIDEWEQDITKAENEENEWLANKLKNRLTIVKKELMEKQ